MAFARWDPFRDLIAIQHRLERLSSAGPHGWAPAVDLCETATTFIIKAELPGLSREQIKIDLHEGRLTIQGRREARTPCHHYHQVERGYGDFSRSFVLPSDVESAGIVADLDGGLLTVTVPKVADAGGPRHVPVA